jgi:hypothetical protein
VVNQVVDYDVAGHGDMLAWALDCIRHRLPEMLRHAGGAELAGRLDPAAVDAALVDVTAQATSAQAAHRARRSEEASP